MKTDFAGLKNYININNIKNKEKLIKIIVSNSKNISVSISQIEEIVYKFIMENGVDEVKTICLTGEIIDWVIHELAKNEG